MCLSAHEFYIVPFVSVHCRLSFEFTRTALNYGTEHWEHSEPLWENKSNPKMPKHAETSELGTARKGVKPSREPSRITITITSSQLCGWHVPSSLSLKQKARPHWALRCLYNAVQAQPQNMVETALRCLCDLDMHCQHDLHSIIKQRLQESSNTEVFT